MNTEEKSAVNELDTSTGIFMLLDDVQTQTSAGAVEKKYCKLCDNSFTTKENIKRHMRIHHGEKLFSCDGCEKVFKMKAAYDKHLGKHDIEETLLVCEICERTFNNNHGFNVHLRVHSEGQPFTQKGSLNVHMKRQKGDKPFKCARAFKLKITLQEHLKTHFGDRLLKCEKCDRSFKYEISLKLHMVMHYREPFNCEMCDKLLMNHENDIDSHVSIQCRIKIYTGKKRTSVTSVNVHSCTTVLLCIV